METVKRKMEWGERQKRTIYNAPVLILAIGNGKVPLTEISAQYHLYNIILQSSASGLGTCLMDSVKIYINSHSSMRKELGVPNSFRVMGALVIGYPRERILNKVEGIKLKWSWNNRDISE